MLLYIRGQAFPHRTFTVSVHPSDSIARVRAHLLHILYEIGKENHQFRLRFKGEYLRDAYSLDEYRIMDNAILTMVSLDGAFDDSFEKASQSGAPSGAETVDVTLKIQMALQQEVNHFTQREIILRNFNTVLNIYGATLVFLVFTNIWYTFFPHALCWWLILLLCPAFSRTTGYTGRISLHKKAFCIGAGIVLLISFTAALFLGLAEIFQIKNGCNGSCPIRVYYSCVVYLLQSIFLLISDVTVWFLLWNMELQMGDLVEKELVQVRDIEQVLKAAKRGRIKDRRIAAFELATLASSGDDNKFRIVAEGGLDILLQMALSHDESTQEHTVETLAELLTIPSIQDAFVTMGGHKTLTALLHSPNPRVVEEAAVAISYIVSDSEENKTAIADDRGLDDLCYAAAKSSFSCQRTIAGIFLELAFNPSIRAQMAARNSPATALIALCNSNDTDTQRYGLQTLELLAIESSDMICAQDGLLRLLLDLPNGTMDEKLYLLAGKVLLYFAENKATHEKMLRHPHIKKSLGHFGRAQDPVLQKVVIKIIFWGLEYPELKARGRHLSLDTILSEIKENAKDREVWDMADQALRIMASDDNLPLLATLSTSEKLNRMNPSSKLHFGSNSSLLSSSKQ